MDNTARLGRLAAIIIAALLCGEAWGQTSAIRREIYSRLDSHDNARAAELIEAHLQQAPDDAVMLYNAACVRCRLGEPEVGASYLIRAVKAGFADFSHMRRDPDLRPIRGHSIFQAILAARDAADQVLAERRVERWRRNHPGDAYQYETDVAHRINYITALPARAHQEMRRMLEDQAAVLNETLFEGPQRHYVLVAVPTAEDLRQMFDEPGIGGVYTHRSRELITSDIGRSLRHEFVHVLHHSHMDELGQQHPLWIQEGIASLYEDYRLDAGGAIEYVANDRQNIAKKLARTGRLMPWLQLVALSPRQLRVEAARVYPQLRSIFRFIAEQDRLQAWYRSYIDRFEQDPAGIQSLERVFDRSLEDIEAQWQRWLNQQPVIVSEAMLGAAQRPSEPGGSVNTDEG